MPFIDHPDRQCTGKRVYSSKRGAKLAQRRIATRIGAVDPLRAYRCSHCGLWHLGHKPKDH